jgi:mRNA interferase RelE/StbE
MEILYTEKAAKQLRKIAKGDKRTASMIVTEIENYASNPSGNFDIKFLKGNLETFKRLRVGNYRIIFDDNQNIVNIYEIKHRQEVYK